MDIGTCFYTEIVVQPRRDLKVMQMWHLGTCVSGGLGSAGLGFSILNNSMISLPYPLLC